MSTDQVLAAALAEHHLPSDETELCLRLVSRSELIISTAQEHAENMVFGHVVLKYDKNYQIQLIPEAYYASTKCL